MEVWQTSVLRRLRLGEEKKERRKKEGRTNHSMKIYMVSLLHRATINKVFVAELFLNAELLISNICPYKLVTWYSHHIRRTHSDRNSSDHIETIRGSNHTMLKLG